VVAELMSVLVAREPEERPAPVRVRVAEFQTSEAIATPEVSVLLPADHISATSVPKEESVREEYVQIVPGSVAKSEVEAVLIAVSVYAFTFAATALVISAVVGAEEVEITKVLSCLTKSPVTTAPHCICDGHVP